MKTKKQILPATIVLLLIACVAGCTQTTDNNQHANANVSGSTTQPAMNAGSPTLTTASPSAAANATTGTPRLPVTNTNSRPPATAMSKPPERVIGTGANDFALFSVIRGQLNQDEQLKKANVIVNIKDGLVTLTGDVANPEQKARVEQIAHGVEGVKGIKNQLRVVAGNSKG